MGYINPEWLNSDRLARVLVANGYYADVAQTVDNDLESMLYDRGVSSSEIPVDDDGFFANSKLQKIGTNYALYKLFSSNKGVDISQEGIDVSMNKAEDHKDIYEDSILFLSRTDVV